MIWEYSSPVQYMLSLDKTVGLIFNTKTFLKKKMECTYGEGKMLSNETRLGNVFEELLGFIPLTEKMAHHLPPQTSLRLTAVCHCGWHLRPPENKE